MPAKISPVVISLLVMLLLAPSAPARDAQGIRRALEARYQHASTLKAIFFERYSDGHGGLAAESGTVYFSRPGRMRWEYESPEKKLFLVDGKNVWFYVPGDRTASHANFKESSDWRTPFSLLAGKADLSRLCRSLEIVNPSAVGDHPDSRPTSAGNTVLQCLPRRNLQEADESVREILFETDPDAHLVRVLIREVGNAETEFRFGGWQENLPIPEVKFHFQPPPGVGVVDEAALAGAIH